MPTSPKTTTARLLTDTLYQAILGRQAAYFTNTWPGLKGGTYPGAGPITLDLSTPENTELNVRGAAAVAQALATAWRAGLLHAQPTLALNALTLAARLVAAVAGSHSVNKTTGPRWSTANQWQEGYWAGLAGTAAVLLDGTHLLTPALRAQVVAMVTFEAERLLGAGPPPVWTLADGTVVRPGDSQAETCQWNTIPLAAAAALTPDHPHQAVWIARAVEYAIVGNAGPGDPTNTAHAANGRTIAQWTPYGYNLRPDLLVTNHNKPVHVDYSMCGTLPIQAALVLALAEIPAPVGLRWNLARVNIALQTVPFNGGTIYRLDNPLPYFPYGNDWGSRPIPNYLAWDGVFAALGLSIDPWLDLAAPDLSPYPPYSSTYWERLRLAEVWAMQNRPTNTSGHREGWIYDTGTNPPEMIYRIREEDAFYKISLAVLAQRTKVPWNSGPI